ncbi:MAG: imidazolonepropionase [Hyphomicrobiales bacterium]
MKQAVYLSDNIATLALRSEGYGLVGNAAIAVENGKIAWVGHRDRLPDVYRKVEPLDFGACLITPGLVDCHTHLVFAGNRAGEFEKRLNGASYEEIAREGGGIAATVNATRAADEDELLRLALPRLKTLIGEGVTTLEVKSGYGLDRDTELRMLRAARRLAQEANITVRTSFLGAHAIPGEYKRRADAYLHQVCLPTLGQAHAEGLADAVDGFCEAIAFSPAQIETVFNCAKALKVPVKLHAEQLSRLGGAQLAARYDALSADHLEYANEADAVAMARGGTVAVLLPGAFYTLKETRSPPVQAFRRHKVPMAVATDCNPGSSPLTSLLLAMNMACLCFGLTPLEALAGTTRNAARALGLKDRGALVAGARADLAVWEVEHPAELSYHMGYNPLRRRIVQGAS